MITPKDDDQTIADAWIRHTLQNRVVQFWLVFQIYFKYIWNTRGVQGDVGIQAVPVPRPHPEPHPEVAAPQILPWKLIFQVRFTIWSGLHPKKLNTCCGELELALNQAEPENHTELVPRPDPDKKNFKFFFQKIKSGTIPKTPCKRTACCVNICPRKGVSHLSHSSRDTLYLGQKYQPTSKKARG